MNVLSKNHLRLADWCGQVIGQVQLDPDEAAVFIAAAMELLPAELNLRAHLNHADQVPKPLQQALQALWLRTGRAASAPALMPEQPLAPNLLGIYWRRLRTALALAPSD